MSSISFNEFLAPCSDIALAAGKLIMPHFHPHVAVQRKADHSPVTEADVLANNYIVAQLARLTPDIPIVAEEDAALPAHAGALFWLVDPLDGTRAFVAGEPEFTVNIGLIHHGSPVLGIIYAPPQDTLYYGSTSHGTYRKIANNNAEKIQVRKPAADGLVIVKSKSHPSAKTQSYLDTLTIKDMRPGSSSVKFCMVAEGSADLYPRFGRTMEWDTAAGHAILNAAGGRVETENGEVLSYGKPGFENPGFIAFGG